MQRKYIELIVDKCLKLKANDTLFVSYDDYTCHDFVEKLKEYLKEKEVKDVYYFDRKIVERRDVLKSISLNDIETHPLFDYSVWEEYASKNVAFLNLVSEIPHFMDEIEISKLAKVNEVVSKSTPIFHKKELSMEIPWCICGVPNPLWAKELFPNDDNAYKKLESAIYHVCMVDTENPQKSWDEYLKIMKERTKKLNELNIKSLHYTNSLGTDLTLALPRNYRWTNIAEEDVLVNMPSYEIFTSPDYLKTNGIVYSSKPLIHQGVVIDDFYLKFKDGKVVSYDAKVGLDMLKAIIGADPQSCYLGECALVDYDSPISNTGLVFGSTLFDENASCHLALGAGFPECLINGKNFSEEELLSSGVNVSKTHVDFMIGTSDLKIEANTSSGIVVLFENGNFVL